MVSLFSKKLAKLPGGPKALALGAGVKTGVDKKEADSASTHTPQTRESKVVSLASRSHLKEAVAKKDAATRFEVILIQEGLGNMKDCFFYTRECLQTAATLFEGRKCMADHPTQIEEQVRPERSVRDVVGHYENVRFSEMDGRGVLMADLCILPGEQFDWARSLLTNSVDYAKKYSDAEFVGLSINASGEADTVGLEEFVRSNELADSVLGKLNLALAEGITEVRPVTRLTEAISCDLVTEAGAGGKILRLIEQEKRTMKKKVKEGDKKEMEKKEADMHKDEEQDKALIKKMVKQYLGDDHEDSEEAEAMAKEAYEAHKEDGMEGEEAYEAAGKHLKMAMKIGKKMAAKKEGECGDEEKPAKKEEAKAEADEKAEEMAKEADEKAEEKKEAEKAKESAQTDLIKANAEIARLRESIKKTELKEYLEKKMVESKKPVSVTKKFREALGVAKSKEHIDNCWDLFVKAYDAGSEDAEDGPFVFTEKNSARTTEEIAEGKLTDLSGCLV